MTTPPMFLILFPGYNKITGNCSSHLNELYMKEPAVLSMRRAFTGKHCFNTRPMYFAGMAALSPINVLMRAITQRDI